jgi:hypothetical protein
MSNVTVTIDRQTKRDLEAMLLQLWMVPTPECLPRKKIELGQKMVLFHVTVPSATFTAAAIFDQPTGGNLIHPLTINPPLIRAASGDLVHYTIHWEGI